MAVASLVLGMASSPSYDALRLLPS